jgi:hypothetical protein
MIGRPEVKIQLEIGVIQYLLYRPIEICTYIYNYSGVTTKIRTGHLPSTSQKWCHVPMSVSNAIRTVIMKDISSSKL